MPTAWELVRAYADKPVRRVIGLMSGTSVDGVDAARVLISGSARETIVELEAFTTLPFAPDLREAILHISHGEGDTGQVAGLNFRVGRVFAEAAHTVAKGYAIDLVGSHGQTVAHYGGYATLQVGEASCIAQQLGVPVVADFRVADVTLGGQGAPLTPYADWCLLTHPTECRAIQNIGGIGNVTYLPANADRDDVLGFDTGPGNMAIDLAATRATNGTWLYDHDGELAAQGTVHMGLLNALLLNFDRYTPPPRSFGREEYGEGFYQWARSLFPEVAGADLVATLTLFTAETIARAYQNFLPQMPDTVIVGGGGARNPTLMRMLYKAVMNMKTPTVVHVTTHEEMGNNGYAREAIAFALLANETMLGNPSNLPRVTGANRAAVLGKVTLP